MKTTGGENGEDINFDDDVEMTCAPDGVAAIRAVVEESDSESEGALEALALSQLPEKVVKLAINDQKAVTQKWKEISLFSNEKLPFLESLSVPNSSKKEESFGDKLATDDLEREKRFAEAATDAVHAGLGILRSMKVKFRRPVDYFAEMVKSDLHMQKIKSRMIANKEAIRATEKRKEERMSQKNKKGRELQLRKEQERKAKGKREIEAFAQLRKERLKSRSQSGKSASINGSGELEVADDSDDEFPVELLDVEEVDAKEYSALQGKRNEKSTKPGYLRNRERKYKLMDRAKSGKQSFSKYGGVRAGRASAKSRKGIIKKRRGSKRRLGKSRRARGRKSV